MNVYLDASILPALTVSDFAKAEFASAIARRLRTNELTTEEAPMAFSAVDVWSARAVRSINASPADISAASTFLRRPACRPDAINIAITERAGCTLFTFDRKMPETAAAIGIPAVPG